MTFQRKRFCLATTTLLLFLLLLCQNHPHAQNATHGRNDTSVVTVHVLEKYTPFATTYQIGAYRPQANWSLIFSFKAHSPSSSTRSSECFQVAHASDVSGVSADTSSGPAESLVLKYVLAARSKKLPNTFCNPGESKPSGDKVNKITYAEDFISKVSLVRVNQSTSTPVTLAFKRQFDFTVLELREWQKFEDVVLVSQIAGQDIAKERFGQCIAPLERQPEVFSPAARYVTDRWLCVKSVTSSAQEYRAMDDYGASFITDVKVSQFGPGSNISKECQAGFKPVIHGIVVPGPGQIDIAMKLYLSATVFNVICYKTSRLVDEVSSDRVPSEKFLKRIAFNESAEPANRIIAEYNRKGLNLPPNTTLMETQVKEWQTWPNSRSS